MRLIPRFTRMFMALTASGAAALTSGWSIDAAPNYPVDPTTIATVPQQYAVDEPLSPAWVLSYPTLLRYAHMPVLMPSANLGASDASPFLASEGFPDTDVNVGQRGYSVAIVGTSLPPWTTDRPYNRGNKTSYTISGCVAQPGPALEWLGIPAGSALDVLPGIPIALHTGVTGYVSYNNNVVGNGGSDTTVRWRVGSYLYDVSVPLPPAQGGLQDAIAAANHMVLLTSDTVAAAVNRDWRFHVVTSDSPFTTYDEMVTLKASPGALPPVPPVADTSPPTPAPVNVTASHGKGLQRGFQVQWTRTQSVVSQPPKTHLSVDRVVGLAQPGGVVQIQGTIMPAPHPGVRLFELWDTAHGSYQLVTLPKKRVSRYWTDPLATGYAELSNVHLSGTHFTASLMIPTALYAPRTGSSNRWAVVSPGNMTFTLAAYDDKSPFFSWQATGHLKVGGKAAQLQPSREVGPYTVAGPTTLATFPPIVAEALAQYGLGSNTVDQVAGTTLYPPVAELMPAWVPAACAPFPYATDVMPLTDEQSIAGGYVATEYKSSIKSPQVGSSPQANLPTTTSGWSSWLRQLTLLVYGTTGPDLIPTGKGQPVPVGPFTGVVYTLPSGTLVRFTWQGTHYGVYLDATVTRSDAVLTARSMTQLQTALTLSPVNVVLAYGQLLHDAKLGDSMAVSNAQSLWQSNAAWEEPTIDSELDKTLLSWSDLQTKVLWSGWQSVVVQFTGMTAPSRGSDPQPVSRTVRFKVSAGGQLTQN